MSRRPNIAPRRQNRVLVLLSDDEYATINAARAAAGGPYLSAFVREAVLAAPELARVRAVLERDMDPSAPPIADLAEEVSRWIALATRRTPASALCGLLDLINEPDPAPTIADVRAAAEREHRIAVGKCPNCNIGLTSLGRCNECGYDDKRKSCLPPGLPR